MTAVRTVSSLSSTYRVHWRSATGDVMAGRLLTDTALQLPQQDEGQEDDDEQDDGDGDADQDGGVVRLRADGLGPGGLAELVLAGEGSDLKIVNSVLTRRFSTGFGSQGNIMLHDLNQQFDTKKIDI